MKTIHMTFNGKIHAINANQDGLFNLNDIAKAYCPISPPSPHDYTKSCLSFG